MGGHPLTTAPKPRKIEVGRDLCGTSWAAAESSPYQNCSKVGPAPNPKLFFWALPPSCSLFLKNLFLLPHIPGFLNPSHIQAAFSLTTRLSFFLLRICIFGFFERIAGDTLPLDNCFY